MIGNLYRDSPFSEIQEPHPQPPPRLRGGDYDVYHVIIAVARLIRTLLLPHKFGLLFPMRDRTSKPQNSELTSQHLRDRSSQHPQNNDS